jgi:hypothetical protein
MYALDKRVGKQGNPHRPVSTRLMLYQCLDRYTSRIFICPGILLPCRALLCSSVRVSNIEMSSFQVTFVDTANPVRGAVHVPNRA